MSNITIQFVWFDLGYTLVYLNREKVYQDFLQRVAGIFKTTEQLALAFHLADKLFMREHPGVLGKKDSQVMKAYYEVLHELLKIPFEVDLFEQHFEESFHMRRFEWQAFAASIETLYSLKAVGIGVGLISNWDQTARTVLKNTGIFPLLDEIIVSSEVGYEKPDKRIFEEALQRIDVSAENCLYVGDNYYDDVVGSRQVGMQSLLINPFGKQGVEEIQDVPFISNVSELRQLLALPQIIHR